MQHNMTHDGESLKQTYDPEVYIEAERPSYVRYQRLCDGRRWEVWGMCDFRGDCIIGAVGLPLGPRAGRLDVPVTPEFHGCCPFRYVELCNAHDFLSA